MHRIKGLLIPWDPDGHIIKNPHHKEPLGIIVTFHFAPYLTCLVAFTTGDGLPLTLGKGFAEGGPRQRALGEF